MYAEKRATITNLHSGSWVVQLFRLPLRGTSQKNFESHLANRSTRPTRIMEERFPNARDPSTRATTIIHKESESAKFHQRRLPGN